MTNIHTLQELENLTKDYADAYSALCNCVETLEAELREVKRRRRPQLIKLIQAAATTKTALSLAVTASPDLFKKPKTRVLHGVCVGFRKQKGKVTFDNEGAVIRRIREQLPRDQAELLIRVQESVHKPAVYDLVAADLKRLGIKIEDDEDKPVVKSADTDIDKLVDALMAEDDGVTEAAA